MNQRIFKKLTKKASHLIDQLEDFNHLTKVMVGVNGFESVEQSSYWICKKYMDNFGCFTQLDGTVGYGCVSGYYEPEWSDADALSELYDWYIYHHADYRAYPEYATSLSRKEHSWKHAFKYAKSIIKERSK